MPWHKILRLPSACFKASIHKHKAPRPLSARSAIDGRDHERKKSRPLWWSKHCVCAVVLEWRKWY
eukprot:8452429-Alexandrium_andersonii.AAC.1